MSFIQMKIRHFFCLSLACSILLPAAPALGWGPAGHAVIGTAALDELKSSARIELRDFLQADSDADLQRAVEEACFWPDTVRESPQWAWSAVLHYVNLPRQSNRYDRQRDCPDGLCVTEGILKYAAELGQKRLERDRRRQAFAWVCHLVADLHQPLHAGFRDDRGGNYFDIEYRGERSNLHRFWDSMLARERTARHQPETVAPEIGVPMAPSEVWRAGDVAAWTEESHALAVAYAYPTDAVISEDFADASWALMQRQWGLAAARLALILNTVLLQDEPRKD